MNAIFQVLLSITIILLYNSNDFNGFKMKKQYTYVLINYTLNIFGNINNMHMPTITYLLSCIFVSFSTGLFEEVLACISGIIAAIIIGIYFACIYHQTKNIWPAIILHTLIAGAIFIVMPFLSTEILQGGNVETITTLGIVLENFILPLIVMILFLIADIVKWRKIETKL